jgi:hypothetical protein
MLDNLSEQIRECYRHAEDCSRHAQAQCDANLKQNFLDAERRWLKLAASYELAERLERFTFKPRK